MDLWNNIKQNNIHIIGVTERKEREMSRKIIWRNSRWKFP